MSRLGSSPTWVTMLAMNVCWGEFNWGTATVLPFRSLSVRTRSLPNSSKHPTCTPPRRRSEEHTSELQSRLHLVCRLLLEKKKKINASLSSPSHFTTHSQL